VSKSWGLKSGWTSAIGLYKPLLLFWRSRDDEEDDDRWVSSLDFSCDVEVVDKRIRRCFKFRNFSCRKKQNY